MLKRTVLIVEDDQRISKLITDYFNEEFNTIVAENGAQALLEFENENVDMVVLDIMLPILDGWEVCKNIRAKSNVPIIMLTAKSDEGSNLKGFELGVDDYINKPFSPKILVAKAKALFKRAENIVCREENIFEIDSNFLINVPSHKVVADKKVLNLSTTEFSVLLYLVRNRDIVLTRNTILDNVWGDDYFGDIRIVDTNIKRLREKLGSKANYIYTVRGFGYKFEVK